MQPTVPKMPKRRNNMAFDIISDEWKRILEIEDDQEQSLAATRYVQKLEEYEKENKKLRALINNAEWYAEERSVQRRMIDSIMENISGFRYWIKEHDKKLTEKILKEGEIK